MYLQRVRDQRDDLTGQLSAGKRRRKEKTPRGGRGKGRDVGGLRGSKTRKSDLKTHLYVEGTVLERERARKNKNRRKERKDWGGFGKAEMSRHKCSGKGMKEEKTGKKKTSRMSDLGRVGRAATDVRSH